mmetsp:Transcript_10364/g.29292  ORF Transcript_10364/g.29292 Transcript_10364/m.29292 type:complete len:89 (-) Transcript_10364:97-363(-)
MQELANTAWAVATMEVRDQGPLLQAISAEALRKFGGARLQPFFDCADALSLDCLLKSSLQTPLRSFTRTMLSVVGNELSLPSAFMPPR